MIHELKTLPEFFQDIEDRVKTFEVRLNDRQYENGDILLLKEWDTIKYTGRESVVRVIYILKGGQFGIQEGYCVMSFQYIPKV